jgi:hypothetical protein
VVNGLECCLLDLEAEPLDLELERTVDVTMRDDRLDGELVVGTPLCRDVVLERCGDVEVLAGEEPKPREAIREMVFVCCGGNARLVMRFALAIGADSSLDDASESMSATVDAVYTSRDTVPLSALTAGGNVGLLRAVKEAIQVVDPSVAGENWDLYVSRLVTGGDPVWVAVDVVKAALDLPSLDAARLKACELADNGELGYDPVFNTITFICPLQAMVGASRRASGSESGVTMLSSYERLCLRYPYGPLGIDAESLVARSLAARKWEGAARVGISGDGRPLTPLSLPSNAATWKRDLALLTAYVVKHSAVSTLVGVDGAKEAKLLDAEQRLEQLRKHSGVIFKELPDAYGGDLIWFIVDDESKQVIVRRVHVKLEAWHLDAKVVCEDLEAGWQRLRHFFRPPRPFEVVIRHFVLTPTRAVAASAGTHVGDVRVLRGAEMRALWSDDIQMFGRRNGLKAYYP